MTATTRSTAGPGFDFEDQFAAWILLSMLHGEPLWGTAASGTRLQMQVKALGWQIDDILVTSGSAPAEQYRAISCKSNQQVTNEKLPADFVSTCWRQWVQSGPNPLRKQKDGFVLVTRGRNLSFMETWTEIKSYAAGSDPALALGRMNETAKFRTMFASLKEPAAGIAPGVSDTDVLELIRAINVQPIDFQMAGSESETIAASRARLLITAGSQSDGQALWNELINEARNTRLSSGTLDLIDLLAHLRSKFTLRDHPDYAKSWAGLRLRSSETRDRVELSLSTGTTIERPTDTQAILRNLAAAPVSVIFGDSGTGKSSLLKAALDSAHSGAEQVWLDPSDAAALLNPVSRTAAGLEQPLQQVLRQAAANVLLVIDAAERLSPDAQARMKSLISEFGSTSDASGCRIVVVGQTDASVDGRLHDLAGDAAPTHEVGRLPEGTVRQVLRSTAGLAHLASEGNAVHALTNVRTLSWVVQAAALFHLAPGSKTLTSAEIADRLWDTWTGSKPTVQRLLIRLAEREATFEHSFAISELGDGDVATLDDLPSQCPLQRDQVTQRIRFSHDLASEWARYRRLRELSGSVGQWQAYAGNPYWHGPIRMLGQHLSRIQVGDRSAWEVAYEAAESGREAAPLADDLLLDTLFLDPDADELLTAQAELLFADEGRRLLRLIKRFEHVASEPRGRPIITGKSGDLSLYIEAEFRVPIYSRWPPLIRFLVKHQSRVAALQAPDVSRLCERWLTGTPLSLGKDQPTPYRSELASLALACARELQTAIAKHDYHGIRQTPNPVFSAALAAARDLPDAVGTWALEMAGRADESVEVQQAVAAYRAEQHEEHSRRMASDASYRERQERLRRLPPTLSTTHRLPAWPLGPQRSIDRDFRRAALGSGGLSALMHASPTTAAEVLLACIIEDEPEEEYSPPSNIDHSLGIEFSSESYPTAPWKSPFLLFFSINPDVAVGAILQLVDFATERWVHVVGRWEGQSPSPSLLLQLPEARARAYDGYGQVFNWSHHNSTSIGPLHSALAALEHWLCEDVDSNTRIENIAVRLLEGSRSSAMVGVLSNLAKKSPALLLGPLRCLAGSRQVHVWDEQRIESDEFATPGTFVHGGQIVFEMGKQWVSQPYRKVPFTDTVVELIGADASFDAYLLEATSGWVSPEGRKASLEFRCLHARLDHRNYKYEIDPKTGNRSRVFVCPAEIVSEVESFQSDHAVGQNVLSLPRLCKERMRHSHPLQAAEAEWLASMLQTIDTDQSLELDEDLKAPARLGVACLLAARAQDWLSEHPAVAELVTRLIHDEVEAASLAVPEGGPPRMGSLSPLQFVAWLAAERWATAPTLEHESMVLKVLTSGNQVALEVLISVALTRRAELGERWWRLSQIALMWSGLLLLKPGYGDEEPYSARWQKWRKWLSTRSLSTPASLASINPIPIAEIVGRMDYRRSRRRQDYRWDSGAPRPAVPRYGGLHSSVLEAAFGWLVRGSPDTIESLIPPAEQTALLRKLWRHQAWLLVGSPKENGDLPLPDPFGYALAEALAAASQRVPINDAMEIWKPLLELGPKGHVLVGHFTTKWFSILSAATNPTDLGRRWRPLIEYVLTATAWVDANPWHQRQLVARKLLGFHFPDSIARVPGHSAVLTSLKDLYGSWAARELSGDEDNLAEFCNFLATEAGRALRLDGLAWIASVKVKKPDLGSWRQRNTSGSFMEFLDVLVAQHAEDLRGSAAAKSALLELATLAAAKQLKASMPLLERIQRL